ncbi:MAG: hypothetical protein J1F01_06765 [Oscillospiraceae bacterium]|nr:hypothetical protein [Oscillospiraceae bacterium]
MKKKLISIVAAAAVVSASGTAAMAENKAPEVFVNSVKIMFADQEPVILGEGYTVVPARGVFEAMGANVEWYEETRTVEVASKDHNTVIKLAIDDSTMRVYDMSNMLDSFLISDDLDIPETLINLDVPPQIIADRTMIPLRAISEALNADVQWDGAEYTISITTNDIPMNATGIPGYSLSTVADTIAEGETVDVYISANNIPTNSYVAAVTAMVKYNKENFEFVEGSLVDGDIPVNSVANAVNTKTYDDSLLAVFVTTDSAAAARTDGSVLRLTFRSLNGGEGEFALTNLYDTAMGYKTTLKLDEMSENSGFVSKVYSGNDLIIDTEPVWVNRVAE